jgi:eukaryotic-like serine/threonine-protein kinase
MQTDCPPCRRVLEFSGDRPSFCAYCGSPLKEADRAVGTQPLAAESAKADTALEETGPMPSPFLTETVEYRSTRPAAGAAGVEEFPDRIAGYRLVRRLGSGGMGTVFEAEDEAQAQRVAVKLIGRDHVSSSEAVERFRQEGKLASAVTHPRCVFVLAVDDYRGAPYIVMELMPGTTLQSLVEKSGPLDPASAIDKIYDVIEGLQEFHKRGLIHRDVKPSNCFLENEGRVKIGDFGLSKSLEGGADLTRTGTFIGTPLYASPEQIKRDLVDERTDVYSVAATLYYLLAGHPPVQAKDAAEALARIASEPAPPLRGYRPDIPRALEAVIHRGLERDPARRWRNLQELHDALVPFVPDRLSIAGIGLRLGAYLVDLGLAFLVNWAIFGLIMLYHQSQFLETMRFQERNREVIGWLERTLWLLYFVFLEGIGGASLGKWLAGLRVNRVDRGGPPGLGWGLVRVLVFYAVTELPANILHELLPPIRGHRMRLTFWVY